MKNPIACIGVLLSCFLCFSFAVAKKPENKCTVDGHGPYNMNLQDCLVQGQRQVTVNCTLKDHDSEVVGRFESRDGKIVREFRCRSKFDLAAKKCSSGLCEVNIHE